MKPEAMKGATLSPCRTWRYALWRQWQPGPLVAFIGLNPSTADERNDDPTIRRCIGFAKRWHYAGIVMLNLYGYRATYPEDLWIAREPVGPGNDDAIRQYTDLAGPCGLIIAAWGSQPRIDDRVEAVAAIIRKKGRDLRCLARNKDGSPKHPLYVKSDVLTVPWP